MDTNVLEIVIENQEENLVDDKKGRQTLKAFDDNKNEYLSLEMDA
jgi:hypothetical protein